MSPFSYYPATSSGTWIYKTCNASTSASITYESIIEPIIYNDYSSDETISYYKPIKCYKIIQTNNYSDYLSTKYNRLWNNSIIYDYGTGTGSTTSVQWPPANYHVPSPAERLRAAMRERMSPAIHIKSRFLQSTTDEREMRARETLRRVIGNQQFFRFLKQGFITARGKSGVIYQIFPGHTMTIVWHKGKMVEKLCVYLPGFPDTDQLIMRYLMALNNESQLRSLSNVHRVNSNLTTTPKPHLTMPLVDLYKQLTAA